MTTGAPRMRHYKDYYSIHAQSYDELRFDSDHEVSSTVEWLLDHLEWTTESVVAEVGAGTCRYISEIELNRPGRYVAVDLNIDQLRHRPSGFLPATCGTALQLPIAAGSLAAYLAIMMIHQVPRPDVPALLLEAHRVLTPGGVLFVKTSSSWDLERRPLIPFFPSTRAVNEKRYHSITDLTETLTECGFTSEVTYRETRDLYQTSEYLKRVKGRGNTMLSFVADTEFEEGYARLVAALEGQDTYELLHHHTYILARKIRS
ncbi:methyltransferase domain-containing protein [Nostocoides sp. F2B08]|uniref:class I SAM-dependent methyltransferase n=1 Tax=Nostocoides sp. F2B08 TaxID=2653936 RepID=UPI001263C2DF|nr:methyltransferase domain-containing protein [Tetrasphaera sp. F2B08]